MESSRDPRTLLLRAALVLAAASAGAQAAAAPAVSITSPATGASVSGPVTVTATASGGLGIVGVQFRVDGTNLGTEAAQAPYTASWNTTTVSNAPHDLTAVARDSAGNKTTSAPVTVVVANVAAQPPSATDRFGIKKIYPTRAGGKVWTSTWDDGVPRAFGYARDPKDPWFDAAHGDARYSVDGEGLFYITGTAPRMYIHDPNIKSGMDSTQEWHDVEMTVYAMRIADKGTPYGGIEAVARTNHATYPEGISDTTDPCDTRGNDARFRYDGHIDFEKETSHPHSVAVSNKAMWPTFPYKKWIGYKLVVYDLPNGDVKLENYMDLTDGAGGGKWTLVNSLEDDGTDFGVGGTPCKAGIDPALRLTDSDARPGSESGRPNATVYWRSDDVGPNGLIYKRMSVREISAP